MGNNTEVERNEDVWQGQEEFINMQKKNCELWSGRRRWRFSTQSDSVFMLKWGRIYIYNTL